MTNPPSAIKEQILDTALLLAEQSGWEKVRLADVSEQLGISLDIINQHYTQKDDLVEAWFDRADRQMLQQSSVLAMKIMSADDRLTRVMMLWFSVLARHRQLTGQTLLYKLEPGHFHLQALGIMRISRTVQWFLEAAAQRNNALSRIGEEIIVTNIFLTGFAYWLNDASAGNEKTEILIGKLLKKAYQLQKFLPF